MKCPYCNDELEHDFCYTCEGCTVDLDSSFYYRDDEEFEQPDLRSTMAHYLHTNEFRNEANK